MVHAFRGRYSATGTICFLLMKHFIRSPLEYIYRLASLHCPFPLIALIDGLINGAARICMIFTVFFDLKDGLWKLWILSRLTDVLHWNRALAPATLRGLRPLVDMGTDKNSVSFHWSSVASYEVYHSLTERADCARRSSLILGCKCHGIAGF